MLFKAIYLWIFIVFCHYGLHTDAVEQGKKIFVIEAVYQGNKEIIQWMLDQGAFVDVKDNEGKTPLIHAAGKEDGLDLVRVLLEAGANLDEKDFEGATVVHLTARSGSLETLKLLYNNVSKPNFTDNEGRTPLHEAAMRGNEDIISFLLEKGESPYFKDSNGLTPIHLAAMSGQTSLLHKMDLKDLYSMTNGTTPLILAALFGREEAAEILVNAGENVNAHDKNLWTPLHAAAFSGNVNILNLLIKNKASIYDRDSEDCTPLYWAFDKGHLSAAKYLLDEGASAVGGNKYGNTLMHAAANSGNLEAVQLLLNKSLDIDKANRNGSTPLIIAAQKGSVEIVRLLTDHGANVNTMDKNGISLITAAASSGNMNLLKAIVESTANLNYSLKDSLSATPLHYSSRSGNRAMVEFIISGMAQEQNSDGKASDTRLKRALRLKLKFCPSCYREIVNIKDVNGRTPSYYAAESGNLEVLEVLLKYGGNFSITDNMGRNALHAAAFKGQQSDVLNFLVLQIMDIDAKDKNGKTALFLSAEEGHLESLKHLIGIGADVLISDKDGWTSMHAAAAQGRTDVVSELAKFEDLVNRKDSNGRTPAWHAVSGYHLETISELKKFGGEIKPMMDVFQAVDKGEWNLAKILFNECDSPLGRNVKGQTLMHVAAAAGQTAIIKTLSEHKCLINRFDNYNKSPAWYALWSGHMDSLQQLEQFGGTINPPITRDSLFEATKKGLLDTLKYLINNGYDVNSNYARNKPLILIAIQSGKIDIVKYLIESGVEFQNIEYLKAAIDNLECNILKLLIDEGANPHALDYKYFYSNAYCENELRPYKPEPREYSESDEDYYSYE